MEMRDGPPGGFTLSHEYVRVSIAGDLFSRQSGLEQEIILRVISQRLGKDQLACLPGAEPPQAPHYVKRQLASTAVLDLSVDSDRLIPSDLKIVADDA